MHVVTWFPNGDLGSGIPHGYRPTGHPGGWAAQKQTIWPRFRHLPCLEVIEILGSEGLPFRTPGTLASNSDMPSSFT